MDISVLWEFAMVAKHGNLSEAARELYMTESALSRHLKALENELKVELYERTPGRIALSPAGELFLPLACDIGNGYERIKTFHDTYRHKTIRAVSVYGVLDSVTLPLLMDAKTQFETDLYQRARNQSQQFQTPFSDIREGRLDVAIEPLSDLIITNGLEWFHIAYERPGVIVEAEHPMANRTALAAKDLENLKFLSLRSNADNALRKHLQTLCKRHGMPGDVPKGLANSPANTYEELLLNGLGDYALMLPMSIATKCASEFAGRYVVIPFGDGESDYDFCAFCSPDAPAHVKRYLDILREVVDTL